tara:strand:- start:102 stop:371 length:270 start_codon:yes stop_codon:yes gene_type:complete
MFRYKTTGKRLSKEKKSYSTTIYKEVPERDDDMYFIAQDGDRCDALAYRFYKDTSLWWFIARVNNLKTNNIPAGTSLRIPVSTSNALGT